MKKYDILKILFIAFLVVVGLTWIIPTGSVSSGEFVLGKTSPLGLFDIIRTPLSTVANFIYFGMVILLIGGFYGIVNETGVYGKIVQNLSKKYEKKFLLFTMIFFIVLASIGFSSVLLLVTVPFFAAVLYLIGYKNKTVFSATIGSILVGMVGITYSSTVNAPFRYFLKLDTSYEIFARIIFLIIISVLFIIMVVNNSKKELNNKSDNKKEIPLFFDTKKNKKSAWPLTVITIILFIFLGIAMYDWQYALNVTFFQELHESISTFTVGDYPLFANILGGVNALGNWTIYDLSIMLMMASLFLVWLYSIPFEKAMNSFLSGVKTMAKPAIYAIAASILFAVIGITQGSSANIFNTIVDFLFNISKNFNIFIVSIVSLIGGIFYNDFTQFSVAMSGNIAASYANELYNPLMAVIMQFMHGIVMLIVPTSVVLVAGLAYFEINYKEWLKYIWKYVLKIFAISLVIIFILKLFV